MNEVTVTQINPLLADSRGLFFEVANDSNIRHIVVTTFTKGAIRGNQFRKNMDQYFFLVSGKSKLVIQSVETGLRQEISMSQGSLVFIPRGMAFATVAEEESILLEYSAQSYDPNNPDINRFKVI